MDKQLKNQKVENFVGGGVENKGAFKEKDWYRDKIIEMVNQINNQDYIEFIYNMLISFKEKWGI